MWFKFPRFDHHMDPNNYYKCSHSLKIHFLLTLLIYNWHYCKDSQIINKLFLSKAYYASLPMNKPTHFTIHNSW
jgi:hypothetical protein